MDERPSDFGGVLHNKLGIIDSEELERAEAEICHVRMVELGINPVRGTFDLAHLQRIHKRLFGDIFDFAGRIRTVNISKGHTTFCLAVHIDAAQRRLFVELKNERFLRGLDKPELVRRLAYHPFRDGNGRAIRVFLQQLAANAGYDLAYREADKDSLLSADTEAFGGNCGPLEEIYASILHLLSDNT